jgi:uncharacterized protein YhaN
VRIERLDLIAFGNLADVSVDLAKPLLHIVYGPNRAGKSTARAAVSNLLYGFDLRTTYAFRHPMNALRLGALLRATDGTTLDVLRFKRTKDPLLESASEKPVPEARWNLLLQTVPRGDFDALFTLGWHELVYGTDELLARDGILGETLFGAGLGVRQLGAVLKALEGESADLFAPHGSTKVVNSALRAATEARKSAAEKSVRPSHYIDVLQTHEKADLRKAELQADCQRLQRDHDSLVTLRSIFPVLQERSAALLERAHLLIDRPAQPRSWAEAVQKAISSRRALTTDQATAARQVSDAVERLGAIAVDETLLPIAERVATLSESITSYVQGCSDRAGLERHCRDAERDALASLRVLTGSEAHPEAFDNARVVLATRDEISQARDQWVDRRAALEQARSAFRDCEQRIAHITDELAALPEAVDPAGLRRAVEAAVRQGDLDAKLSSEGRALTAAQHARLHMAGSLALTEEDIRRALSSPAPSSEEIEQILESVQEYESQARTAQGRAEDAEGHASQLGQQLTALALEVVLPTEDDLTERRGVRDAGWALVKSSWLDHKPVTGESTGYEDERALALSYEMAGTEADQLVDRLWREADRTARRKGLLQELERAQSGRAQDNEKAQLASEGAVAAYGTWCAVWSDQRFPQSPKALRQWSANLAQLRSLDDAWTNARLAHRETFRGLRSHRRRISTALLALHRDVLSGLDLQPLLVQAQSFLVELEGRQRERSNRKVALAACERDLPTKETALQAAVEEERTAARVLTSLLGPYGARVDSPQGAAVALTQLNSLSQCLDTRDGLTERIRGIDARSAAFESELRDLLMSTPELAQVANADVARDLVRRVKDARAADDKRHGFVVTRDLAQVAVDDAEHKLVGLRETFALLAREGKVDDPEQLEDAAERAFRILELNEVVADCEKRLAQDGNGQSTAELEEAVVGRTPTDITEAIDALNGSLDDLKDELEKARDAEVTLRVQLQGMDGSDAAAVEASRGQLEISKALEASARFTRLALAHFLLEEAIRRYSEAHQDPLLTRASSHLSLLTADEYRRVGVDVDSKSGPRLSVIAANGEELLVPALSSGSRDQLYFALRLAAIEESFAKYGPMPVLLDDVLVNFDDPHSVAALRILATMATTSQVVLFTHHPHVLALAKGALAADAFVLHELPTELRETVP